MKRVSIILVSLIFFLLGCSLFADDIKDCVIECYNEALTKYMEGDLGRALKIIENEVIPKDRTFHIAYYLLAVIDAELGFYPDVVLDINRYFENLSDEWVIYLRTSSDTRSAERGNAYTLRGYAHRETGHFDEAIADYTEAIKIFKDFGPDAQGHLSSAYYDRGISWQWKLELDNAEADYIKSIEHDGNYFMPYAQLYIIYSSSEEYLEECIKILEKMAELDRDSTVHIYLRQVLPHSWLYLDPRFERMFPEYEPPNQRNEPASLETKSV